MLALCHNPSRVSSPLSTPKTKQQNCNNIIVTIPHGSPHPFPPLPSSCIPSSILRSQSLTGLLTPFHRPLPSITPEAGSDKHLRGSINTAAFSCNLISTVETKMVLKQPVEKCEGPCSDISSLRPSRIS